MKEIIKTAGEILCVLAVLVIIAAALLLLTGTKPAVVLSGSMEPTIHTGSIVLIHTNVNTLKEKDIVAFERGGTMVVHRLVGKTDEGWITRGDANQTDDPWRVQDEEITGKTVFWIPKLGYLMWRGA